MYAAGRGQSGYTKLIGWESVAQNDIKYEA